MASVSSRLSALCAKIQGLAEPGTDRVLRHVSMACIYVTMDDLGNAAVPSTRTSLTPGSTSQFYYHEKDSRLGYCSCVRKMHHYVTRKTFALKTLKLDRGYDVDWEEKVDIFNLRVLRQACFMAACRGHPSLVRFYDVYRYRCRAGAVERYCLVMEHVGPSLREVLVRQRRGKPFPEHEVRRMTRQVLSGAKAMHDRGIVHRGIRPGNVLVGAGSDIVKIGGFGQATYVSETDFPPLISRDTMQGMAPEVLLQGEGALGSDELVDSWSIGCLMAELLTGKPLFEVMKGNDAVDQLYRIFGVTGVPGKRTMKDMKHRTVELAKEVRKWGAKRLGVGKLRSNSRLRKLVPHDVLSDDGFQVLQGLLTCSPKKRLTVGAALQLPWFANDEKSPAGRCVLSASRPWPFTWLLVSSVLALLFFGGFLFMLTAVDADGVYMSAKNTRNSMHVFSLFLS